MWCKNYMYMCTQLLTGFADNAWYAWSLLPPLDTTCFAIHESDVWIWCVDMFIYLKLYYIFSNKSTNYLNPTVVNFLNLYYNQQKLLYYKKIKK